MLLTGQWASLADDSVTVVSVWACLIAVSDVLYVKFTKLLETY